MKLYFKLLYYEAAFPERPFNSNETYKVISGTGNTFYNGYAYVSKEIYKAYKTNTYDQKYWKPVPQGKKL